jgi:hypothetical protein
MTREQSSTERQAAELAAMVARENRDARASERAAKRASRRQRVVLVSSSAPFSLLK